MIYMHTYIYRHNKYAHSGCRVRAGELRTQLEVRGPMLTAVWCEFLQESRRISTGSLKELQMDVPR